VATSRKKASFLDVGGEQMQQALSSDQLLEVTQDASGVEEFVVIDGSLARRPGHHVDAQWILVCSGHWSSSILE
jgi:hypothetical protein